MNTTTRKHMPWLVAAGSALALTGTLVFVQPWQAADAVELGAEATTVAVTETPAPVEAAPVVEVVETPEADVVAEAAPAAAPATSAPTATPAPTATSTTSAPAANGAVSRGRAIELAIAAAGGGRAVDVSQGSERGIPTWEILVRRNDGSQVEVYVNRNNGNIVKVENANDW